MSDASFSNAMTEIALALAMAFFSVMVLAMVSMSVPREGAASVEALDSTLDLTPAASENDSAPQSSTAPFLIIFYKGRFLAEDFRPLDISRLPESALVLAIAPDMEMAAAMRIRERIPRPDLTVTTLDDRWITALKEIP